MVCWSIQQATSLFDIKNNCTRFIIEQAPLAQHSKIVAITVPNAPKMLAVAFMLIEHEGLLSQFNPRVNGLLVAWDNERIYTPGDDDYLPVVGDCPQDATDILRQPYETPLTTELTVLCAPDTLRLLTIPFDSVGKYINLLSGQHYITDRDIINDHPIDTWPLYNLVINATTSIADRVLVDDISSTTWSVNQLINYIWSWF